MLVSLELTTFRNLRSLSLLPETGINILWGSNGVGKTSVLEAIHLLCMGRSFRSQKMDEAISWDADFMRLAASRRGGGQVHLVKRKGKLPRFELNSQYIGSATELARSLPVELLDSQTAALISGVPALRRSFMDRGIFATMPGFTEHRRRYDSAMRQRNRLLRRGQGAASLAPWEAVMGDAGEAIARARESWLQSYRPVLLATLDRAEHSWANAIRDDLTLSVERGWTADSQLTDALCQSRERDRRLGHSSCGPHRADLLLRAGDKPVALATSGGQRKLLASLMVLAQGQLLAVERHLSPLYLLDDLAAELDSEALSAVCGLLVRQGGQSFMTALTEQELDRHWQSTELPVRKFPLEQLAEVA